MKSLTQSLTQSNNMKLWKGEYELKAPVTTPYLVETRNGWIISPFIHMY
jgi:hypothetical protein